MQLVSSEVCVQAVSRQYAYNRVCLVPSFFGGENVEVHVVVGIWQGVIDSIEAFSTVEKANENERALCKSYDVPYDAEERKEYDAKGEVYHYILTVDKST